jgi:hypothetical protein
VPRGRYPLLGIEENNLLSNSMSGVNLNNNSFSRRRKQNSRRRTGKGRRPRLGKRIVQVLKSRTEVKALTYTYHHWNVAPITSVAYNDGGLYLDGWTCINLIAQGNTANTRNGSQIELVDVKVTFSLYAPSAAPDSVRILLIKDLAPKNVAPPLNEIFDNTANPLTAISPDCTQQYKLLSDSIIDLGGSNPTRTFTRWLKLNARSYYFGSTSTLASVENGAIYIFIWSINAVATTEVLQYASLIRFRDI